MEKPLEALLEKYLVAFLENFFTAIKEISGEHFCEAFMVIFLWQFWRMFGKIL